MISRVCSSILQGIDAVASEVEADVSIGGKGALHDELAIDPARVVLEEAFRVCGRYDVDFANVRGQESAKRALTIGAAGDRSVFMIGPPGSGKTVYGGP